MIEGNDGEDVAVMSEAFHPLVNVARYTGGMFCGISSSLVNTPLATMSGDPDRPSFIVDFTASDGRIDGRWLEYLLPDVNFRISLPLHGYLYVYTQAFTSRMILPIHPFVKDFFHLHDISHTQLASNF